MLKSSSRGVQRRGNSLMKTFDAEWKAYFWELEEHATSSRAGGSGINTEIP